MSQAVHLVAQNLNLAGYGPAENRCLPCLGVSGRAVTVSSCSSHGDLRIRSQVKIGAVKYVSKPASFVCNASSGGHKRNPDFLRQNKNGFRGRNRQNEDRDSFDDESELFPSKNGPLLSLSSSPKFQATAAPGSREKEIVELFRKVQAQLRERAAAKEDKKMEALQGQRKESETVDSLLKLLRKHSVEQGKRKSSSVSNKDFNLDHTEQNVSYNEDKSASFFDSSSKARPEAKEPNSSSLTRPPSNFRRKSPVTQFKYQSVYSNEDTVNSGSTLNSSWKRKNSIETYTIPKHEPVPEPEPEPELEPEVSLADGVVHDEVSDSETNIINGNVYDEVSDSESNIIGEGVYDEISEGESSDIDVADNDEDRDKQEKIQHEDLSALKLPELRSVAKSRGVKGFSRMKKAELVELLSGSSV
ncbi:hypothetical protein Ddye_016240 [Dipteronia dyeriana]|uniref:Rho termination factor-like N-terminal domain-containing protein n=1 Tax=Dipteronia dyeriana TaxID=168575 RepID=A0AAD9WZD2_9ROSI|nr:hypothetical protein Ddye_016240 [Dipteronia dyeriana]